MINYVLAFDLGPYKVNILKLGLFKLKDWIDIAGKPLHLVFESPVAIKSLL